MDADLKKKVCFVVGPIGDPNSDTRVHSDWLLEEIIQPALSKYPEISVVRADQIAPPGMIDAQVIEYLLDSDLVIADLSKENPNAFYEIGIRHMAQKPIIHMQLSDEKIPFDVSLYRTLKFSCTRPADLRVAREELKRAIDAVFADGYKIDNPITRARGQINLEQHATSEEKVLLDQLKSIRERLDSLESTASTKNKFPWETRDVEPYAMAIIVDSALPQHDLQRLLEDIVQDVQVSGFIDSYQRLGDRILVGWPKSSANLRRAREFRTRMVKYRGVSEVRDIATDIFS